MPTDILVSGVGAAGNNTDQNWGKAPASVAAVL